MMKLKSIFSVGIAVALAASITTATVVSADTATSGGTLQYSQVETLVKRDNLQIKNNALTLKNLKNNDAMKDAKEQLESAAKGLNQMVSLLDGIIQQAGSQTDPSTKQLWNAIAAIAQGNKTSLSSLVGDLNSQIDQMETSDDQIDLVELQLNQVNDQLVNAAQNLFTGCKQMEISIQQASASRPLLQSALTIAQTSLKNGSGTQVQVTEAQLKLNEFDQSIAKLKTQMANLHYQLNHLLGRSYNVDFTLGALPEPDLTYFNKANLAKDVATAQQWNYTVRYKNKEYKQIENDNDYNSIDRQKQMKQNEIIMEQNSIGASVTNLYNTINNLKQSYTLQQQQENLAKTKYDQAVLKFNKGVISATERDSAQADYLSAKATVENTKVDLFWQIENYKWVLRGLSAG